MLVGLSLWVVGNLSSACLQFLMNERYIEMVREMKKKVVGKVNTSREVSVICKDAVGGEIFGRWKSVGN